MKTIVLKSDKYFYKIHYIDNDGTLHVTLSLDDIVLDDISDSETPSYDDNDYILEYHDDKWFERESKEELSIFLYKKASKEIEKTKNKLIYRGNNNG